MNESIESFPPLSDPGAEWRGHVWHAKEIACDVRFWTADDAYSDDDRAAMGMSVDAARDFIQVLRHEVPWAAVPVDIAMFSHNQFLSALDLDQEALSWVTGSFRDGALCIRQGLFDHASYAKHRPAKQVGVLHELMHVVITQLSGRYDPVPLAINEGLCEVVPRLLVSSSEALDEDLQFLATVDHADLLTASHIESHGMFGRSTRPPATNPSYASASCLVVGLAVALHDDIGRGVEKLIELARRTSKEDYWAVLAAETSSTAEAISSSLEFQENGLQILRRRSGDGQ